eukprot:CAMPEP_0196575034 /NCGR_PEP_ID=MMETSP1081-20130531/4604_1 /TAXON_ID=36882 /ORGANISM="Pyramimonas amylifera, Strain CCMP720" /LENGTH=793 /DNA_ID=CAMNT_0041893219 /DNA_START=114 /DNA_END=2495 /DNA_ORIENTATION=-
MSDSEDDIPLALRVAATDNRAPTETLEKPSSTLPGIKSESQVLNSTCDIPEATAVNGFTDSFQKSNEESTPPAISSLARKIPKKSSSKSLQDSKPTTFKDESKHGVHEETPGMQDNKSYVKIIRNSDSVHSSQLIKSEVDVKPVISKNPTSFVASAKAKVSSSTPSYKIPVTPEDAHHKINSKPVTKRPRDDPPPTKSILDSKKVKTEAGPQKKPVESSCSSDSSTSDDSDSSKDDEPLSKRSQLPAKSVVKKKIPVKTPVKKETSTGKRLWDTLEHQGVIFPPEYVPHGVKLLYDGNPVNLSPPEEEIASMFAAMQDTDYATKSTFLKNFWHDFRNNMTPQNKKNLKSMELCDFTLINQHIIQLREKKKLLTKEEKLKIKEEREKLEAPYLYATIDGRREKVGNFRVEPPGLFRGRGEHPKMGKLKKRIYPEDVIINIGEDSQIPDTRYPGHSWGEIRHVHDVTWLAGWKDSVNTSDWKYVQFAAQSSIKGDSDLKKYEKARKLKDFVDRIRKDYIRGFDSSDDKVAQMSVAVYLIDKLALRAGGEKDDDLADTVGCCTLRVGHVILEPPSNLKLDFLGKDSIRYEQTHEVLPSVFQAIKRFCKGKKPDKDLFDLIQPSMVNEHLQTLMEGLTIKVFRTYNASIVLDCLLADTVEGSVPQKKAQYDAANKEVAILCNHQKGVSKQHDSSMEKLREKRQALEAEMKALIKQKNNGMEKKIATLNDRISKANLVMSVKEELKTVSLGTSKTNYLDPRISIAWCKKWEVPLNVVFTRSLIDKFNWAVEVDPSFRF